MMPKKPKRECSACSSTGRMMVVSFVTGKMDMPVNCSHCKGTGQYIDVEAERDYYKAVAERAIEALKWYADHMGKSTSMDMRVFVQEAGNKAKQALAEIQASEEE